MGCWFLAIGFALASRRFRHFLPSAAEWWYVDSIKNVLLHFNIETMSRGFVKEGDQEEVPMLTPRAFLPAGVENFVTTTGLEELKAEREEILRERKQYEGVDNNDARVNNNYLTGKLRLLEERIHSARVLDYDPQRQNDVAFGATIKFKNLKNNQIAQYQIVGVDEANIMKGKISFLSPLSKVLMNKKVGETVSFNTPQGEMQMEILSIS
jgi:transcription elongation factor GreB